MELTATDRSHDPSLSLSQFCARLKVILFCRAYQVTPEVLLCQGAQNIGPTINVNTRYSAPYDHNARPSQTAGQTDELNGNCATIRSNERIAH